MSRLVYALAAAIGALLVPTLARPQALPAQTGTPPERIDLLEAAKADEGAQGPVYEDCSSEQEAAVISGEIVVCRRRSNADRIPYDREAAQTRYATETMNAGNPQAPNFVNGCKEQGWPAGCFRFGKVPPPAYMIDVAALPAPPPGSDAERVSQGLAPRGVDAPRIEAEAVAPAPEPALSPSGSASAAAEP